MKVFRRRVGFHEVDAAGLLYFPRFLSMAHEAMEDFFCELSGGYRGLIVERKLGLPAVQVHCEFHGPLRYGDQVEIQTRVKTLGQRSLVFEYRFMLADRLCATIEHKVVCTDLQHMKSAEMPADLRSVAEAHLVD